MKSKDTKETAEEEEDDQVEEDVFNTVTKGRSKKIKVKLDGYQEQLQTALGKVKQFSIGRIRVDPAQLRSPPEQHAARIVYPEHLRKLFLHFLTGGELYGSEGLSSASWRM